MLSIVKAALEADFNRNSVFVGIGGGVITDMTAFAASIFKRGAKLELIPTSLWQWWMLPVVEKPDAILKTIKT